MGSERVSSPGLYILVIICALNSCSADEKAGKALKVGQRVRPSKYGIERYIFPGAYRGFKNADQTGVVTKVDEFGCPTVKWSRKKKPLGYYYGFIDIDRRRTRP